MSANDPEKTGPIVYIVDDDAMVRKALQRLITSIGLKTLSFTSAEEFLEHEIGDQHSCLIADVTMPHIAGPELQHRSPLCYTA